MSNLFYRDLRSPPVIAHHSANELIVAKDECYCDDLSAGAGITCLGHSNEAIKEAMSEQLYSLPYVHAMNWSSEPAEELAARLIELTVRGDPKSKFNGGKVIFLNSGAEAVEAACKVAMQVGYEQRKPPRFYGRQYSYHGNTMFTLALGDHPKKQLYPFASLIDVRRFPAYRPSCQEFGMNLGWLSTMLEQPGFQNIVVIEPVGGTTIGIEPSTITYLDSLQHLCQQTNSILIYDEVLCGNYRTGELFAYQYYGSQEPDIICLGKGLTGGYFPLSAVIVSNPLVNVIEGGSGKLWHSTTNQNHPVGCAAGVAALVEYERLKPALPQFGLDVRRLISEELFGEPSACPKVSMVGVGSLIGLRLDPELPGLHLRVRHEALKQGIVVYTDGGTVDGKGNMVLLAPPYSFKEDMSHLRHCLQKLARVVFSVGAVVP